MKLDRSSPHDQITGAKNVTEAISGVFRTQLMASFSIDAPQEEIDKTWEKSLSEYHDEGDLAFQLPPALMLDYMDNNVSIVLTSMEEARQRIANRCIELLGVTDTTISDDDLNSLLDTEKGDQDS